MALEKQSREIGGITYEVTQLGAKAGNRVLLKVAKSVGPVFLLAASAGAKLDSPGIVEAIRAMNEDDFEFVVAQLAAKTDVVFGDGRAPSLSSVFDVHFAGKYEDQLAWIAFALEVNFGPFFLALKRQAADAAARAATAPSKSTSPSTSTGASNAS